jgi:hypothetical protein
MFNSSSKKGPAGPMSSTSDELLPLLLEPNQLTGLSSHARLGPWATLLPSTKESEVAAVRKGQRGL